MVLCISEFEKVDLMLSILLISQAPQKGRRTKGPKEGCICLVPFLCCWHDKCLHLSRLTNLYTLGIVHFFVQQLAAVICKVAYKYFL